MRYYLVFICTLLQLQTATAQTVTTYDINPGQMGSYPNFFTPFKGRLYFVAFDSTNGVELRSIDSGTSPRLEYDLAAGWSGGMGSFINGGPGNNVSSSGAISKQMAVVKDGEGKEMALYFYGTTNLQLPATIPQYSLFKYDGTTVPVPVISNINAGTLELAAIKDKVYFTVHVSSKDDLYEYNQTLNSYKKIHTGKVYTNAMVSNLTVYKSKLFFIDGNEIWEYDPATGQEHMLTGFASYLPGSCARVIGGVLYFTYDGLYSYDGTNITRIGQDYVCLPPANRSLSWTNIQLLGDYNGKVYFPCNRSPNCLLCAYDPATKTTQQITANSPSNFAMAQNKLFFRAYDATNGYELWSYDGAKANLELDVFAGTNTGTEYSIVSFKDDIYFAGSTGWGSGNIYDYKGIELQKFVPKTSGSGGGGGGGGTNVSSTGFTGKVNVYPNPAESSCSISIELTSEQLLQVAVYNYMGGRVYASPVARYAAGNTSISLPVNELASGVYTITINDDQHRMVYNTRLVKR